MIRLIQLGNGGGLDVNQTNSSFLIEVATNEYLLFDCGFNIMQRLTKLEQQDKDFNISQIKHVFISHTHMDHVGGLETLIFHNYFMHTVQMSIYAANTVTFNFVAMVIPTTYFTGSKEHEISYIERFIDLSDNSSRIIGKSDLTLLKNTYHPCSTSNGIALIKDNKLLVITGDTKASQLLEKEVLDKEEDWQTIDTIIFHDYSLWNCPSKNVHACKTDFEAEYTEEFKNKIIKYHTGQKFNEDWIEF